MPHFPIALDTVLNRTFGGKQSALAAACDNLQQSDISRLVRNDAPVSEVKLYKLLRAEGLPRADYELLLHAAVRDYVGEEAYLAHFAPQARAASPRVSDSLDGSTFRSLFPLHPRAQQVIAYLIHRAGTDKDVVTALELLGKFLELPAPLDAPTEGLPV